MATSLVTRSGAPRTTKQSSTAGEIAFIPNDEFATLSESQLNQVDFDLYEVEEHSAASTLGETVSASLRMALEQSRLLTFEGEQYLFKCMNFFRYRASTIQSALTTKRPSKKKLREMNRLLSEADRVRDELTYANLRLVVSIAGKLSISREEFDEFIAEGNGILLYAIDKFDFSRGYRFSTYLTHAVQRHLYRVINRRRKRAEREFASDRTVTANEPSVEVELSEPADREIQAAAAVVISRMDNTLTDREQFIIRGRFGLDGTGESKPYRVLGEQLNLSKERVRQLFQQSISKLGEIAKPFESLFLTT